MNDLNPELWKRDDRLVSFFNPLERNVEVEYLDDANTPQTITLPLRTLFTYPKHIADICERRLLDAIKNDRKLGYVTPEKEKELLAEIQTT